MGQKAYTLTLKPKYTPLNLQTFNSQAFLVGNFFLTTFKTLLLKKNIVLSNCVANFAGNVLAINFTFFFKTAKVFFFRKKPFKKISLIKPKAIVLERLSHYLFKNLEQLRINSIVFSINILNQDLNSTHNRALLKFFYQKTQPFLNILFQRRFTLYFDFIKQIVFLINGLIPANVFLQIVGQLFKHLHKKIHSRFFIFFNLVSNLIINVYSKKLNFGKYHIKGIKLLIKGRLQGKMRASSKILQEGKIPIQSFNHQMDVAKQHVYTLYGVYGLKLWVFRV